VLGVAEWCALHLPVDRYIAISTSTLEKMVAKGVPRHAIDLVPCGFDPTAAERIRSERVCGPPRPTLVVVSRLVPYKRVDVVIRALAILSSDIDDITLRIVGQGPDRRRLESLAQELGVADRVRFEGFVGSHDEVLGMVAEARCLVSASEIEGFGIVVVEAQSVGVPVVLSDIPAFKELVPDGHGGRLFSAGNAAALAAAVRPFLVDDERWTAASREAIEHSARYRWSAVAEATAATYERAVGRRLMSVTAVNA
jgi:glycosyltransferase involved in cell wall biosynthesis